MAVKKKVAKKPTAKPTAKTVALTVTLKVAADMPVRGVASIVRGRLERYSPRVTPIKEA